jgi:hypothetical protein
MPGRLPWVSVIELGAQEVDSEVPAPTPLVQAPPAVRLAPVMDRAIARPGDVLSEDRAAAERAIERPAAIQVEEVVFHEHEPVHEGGWQARRGRRRHILVKIRGLPGSISHRPTRPP